MPASLPHPEAAKGFDIFGVAVDPSKGRWRNAVKRDKLPWYNVCEGVNGSESKNVQNFAVKKVPRNYLVNSQGIIVGRDILPDSLERRLKEL